MGTFLLSMLSLGLFAAAAYGWGRSVTRYAIKPPNVNASFSVAVGLAMWVFFGGILNAANMAYPVALWLLLGMGWLLAGYCLFTDVWRCQRAIFSEDQGRYLWLLPLFLVIIVTAFLAAMLMPSELFNYHDDLHAYFSRPVRLLQTGSFGHSSFLLLGADSLGGQAFLHAFSLLVFPISYLNGFDAVFCVGLSAALLVALSRKLSIHPISAVAVLIIMVSIHPQTVNISTLYSAVAMILALVYASLLLTHGLGKGEKIPCLLACILIGALLATLVSLKITFAAFSGIYFVVLGSLLLWVFGIKRALISASCIGVSALIAIFPWVLFHSEQYLFALNEGLNPSAPTVFEWMPKKSLMELLSRSELFLGGSQKNYNALMGVLFLLLLWCIWRLYASEKKNRGLVAVIAALLTAILVFFLNAIIFDAHSANRYSLPVLIAVVPVAVIVFLASLKGAAVGRYSIPRNQAIMAVSFAAAVVVMFWQPLKVRVNTAMQTHSTVSFTVDQPYRKYLASALGQSSADRIRKAQQSTLAGEGIFSYISAPYWMDFRRNPVLLATDAGLTMEWNDIPIDRAADFFAYLKEKNVRYVMWEYSGFGMKSDDVLKTFLKEDFVMHQKMGKNNLLLRDHLDQYAVNFKRVYMDSGLVVIDLMHTQP